MTDALLFPTIFSADYNTTQQTMPLAQGNKRQTQIIRIVFITVFPSILVVGTIGNVLTFIVMQRGCLRHSSTCFYMAMLALADTSECELSRLSYFVIESTFI